MLVTEESKWLEVFSRRYCFSGVEAGTQGLKHTEQWLSASHTLALSD